MLRYITRKFSSFTNSFTWGVWSIPAPEKQAKGGEDAYFASPRALAIADGVGGWASYGVDPSKYAWELMRNVEKSLSSIEDNHSPFFVLKDASKNTKEVGSSTCCLLILDPEKPELHSGNIGDSGFILYRYSDNELSVPFKADTTSHGFNYPYQLGTDGDSPERASFSTVTVQDKDLIVMFTDGLSDNVFDEQVASIVKPFLALSDIPDMEIIAEMLAEKAKAQSENEGWESPFAVAAKRVPSYSWEGGKPDDITVFVAQINLKSIE